MFPRWLRLALAIAVFAALVAALFVFVPLYRSLPDRGGRVIFPGLADVAAVQRDKLGIVRVSAATRRDAAKLLGFAHAQDRFFQMDLLRRTAAGELAELLGPAALPTDRAHRRLRLREVARAALEKLPEPHRELVEDYTLGVNAGLYELESPSFEYLLLRTTPRNWQAEDSFLVIATMALVLQGGDGELERSRQIVRESFDVPTAEFLLSAADDFEAALDDSHLAPPPLPAAPGIRTLAASVPAPTAATAPVADDFGARVLAGWVEQLRAAPETAPGSNAFALRGLIGKRPVALLANDMHLPLAVPNLWYRTEIAWRLDPRRNRTVDGITLPGLPVLVAGSNGAVAWGFTDARIDTADLILLETDPANPRRYRTPEGWRELEARAETIAVRGAPAEMFTFDTTIWGPVLGPDAHGRPLVLKWVLADPAAYDLQLANLETVNSARAALAFAKSSGLPHLNIIAADREGNLGWTIAGRLPRRVGFDGSTPVSWADGSARWDGWQPLDQYPQVFNPPSGRLWSANNRMVGGDDLALLGDGGYSTGTRARRLRDQLAELKDVSPEKLLALQLDVRALYLDRWQQLLVATLDAEAAAAAPARAELRRYAEAWGGEAVPSSAGYRLVHDFRAQVLARVDHLVFDRCRAAVPTFSTARLPLDRIAYALVDQRPAGWHPAGAAGWRQLLLEAADATVAEAGGPSQLSRHTWGEANRLAMRHPLSRAFPALGRFIDMPADPLPGDPLVVRAQTPGFGASVRFVIQPGWEEGSLLQMPGGQSGHPLSPYYSDGHKAWVRGEPTPLQPGKVADHMVFAPPAEN